MYEKAVLGLAEARQAMRAMLDEAMKEPDRPVAIAIVDDDGALVSFARMDGCRPLPRQLAIKKAYTAGTMRSDTGPMAERMREAGINLSELGDPNLAGVRGGVVIQRSSDSTFLGGIGVSGLRADEDENLARIGVQAMKL